MVDDHGSSHDDPFVNGMFTRVLYSDDYGVDQYNVWDEHLLINSFRFCFWSGYFLTITCG